MRAKYGRSDSCSVKRAKERSDGLNSISQKNQCGGKREPVAQRSLVGQTMIETMKKADLGRN